MDNPGGTKLGQVDRKNLINMNELACPAEGKELALKECPRFLAGGGLQPTSLFVLQEHANRIFDSRTTGLHLIDAGRIRLGFLLTGVSLDLFPASRSGRLTNGFSIGQDATEPFRTTTAPSLRIVIVIAIGGMTGVDVEHETQPPYKEVNSGGGTKLAQFAYAACKHMK